MAVLEVTLFKEVEEWARRAAVKQRVFYWTVHPCSCHFEWSHSHWLVDNGSLQFDRRGVLEGRLLSVQIKCRGEWVRIGWADFDYSEQRMPVTDCAHSCRCVRSCRRVWIFRPGGYPSTFWRIRIQLEPINQANQRHQAGGGPSEEWQENSYFHDSFAIHIFAHTVRKSVDIIYSFAHQEAMKGVRRKEEYEDGIDGLPLY